MSCKFSVSGSDHPLSIRTFDPYVAYTNKMFSLQYLHFHVNKVNFLKILKLNENDLLLVK